MNTPTIHTPGPNRTTVTVGDLTLHFSYDTLVAFEHPVTGRVVHANSWTVTTGKHLAAIDGGTAAAKAARVRAGEFRRALETAQNATVVTVLHEKAGHTVPGNPRRLFVGLNSRGDVVRVTDEGLAGTPPWVRDLERAGTYPIDVPVTVTQYRARLKAAD